MKKLLFFLLLLMPLPSVSQGTTVYEWRDEQGVYHFTDSLKNVPQKYLNKARARDMGPSQPQGAPGGSTSTPNVQTLPPVDATPTPTLYGGRTGLWWRTQFQSLKAQIATLQDGLSAKEARLAEVRRRHVIFQRPSDRTAANELAAEIDRDQAQIKELQGVIGNLQMEADRSAVPVEWR